MKFENTELEDKAIKQLELAFKNCSKLGIKFSVMDNSLLYANKRLYKECDKIVKEKEENNRFSGVYPTVAYAQDTELSYCPEVNCYKSMDSCGGW